MHNIKKARYSKAYKMASTLEWVHKDIGVIKITGTPENLKQINIFLPLKYVLKEIGDSFALLFLNEQERIVVINVLSANDWISVNEDDEVRSIFGKDFNQLVTLVY